MLVISLQYIISTKTLAKTKMKFHYYTCAYKKRIVYYETYKNNFLQLLYNNEAWINDKDEIFFFLSAFSISKIACYDNHWFL